MQFKSFGLIIILLISTILGFFSSVYADDFFTLRKKIEDSSWRKIGFVYIKPSLIIQDVGYSSNIYSFEESAKPDWTADLGVEFIFSSIISRRIIFRIKETPYYSFYLHNKKEENFNNIFNGEMFTYLGKININYFGVFE